VTCKHEKSYKSEDKDKDMVFEKWELRRTDPKLKDVSHLHRFDRSDADNDLPF
jgi:hypothetical protein